MLDAFFSYASRIERWSFVNALGMLGAAAIALWLRNSWPLLVMGGAMLGGLVVVARERWTPDGSIGAANAVTALRVGLLGLLPPAASAGAGPVIGLSLFILGTDGVDGWLARRRNTTTEFGAFFDKETDALFLLVLCGLAAFHGRVPLWIVGIGLLRYVFVLALFLVQSSNKTEERSTLARYLYGGMVTALLLSFLPYPTLYRPLVFLATAALFVSFARSFWRIVPRRETFGQF